MTIAHGTIGLEEASMKYGLTQKEVSYIRDRGWTCLSDNANVVQGLQKECEFYWLVHQYSDWQIRFAPKGDPTHDFVINGLKTEITKKCETLDEHKFQLVMKNEVSLIIWDDKGWYYVNDVTPTSAIQTNPITRCEYRRVSYSISKLFGGNYHYGKKSQISTTKA